MEKLKLDIELLLPHVPDERDSCAARLLQKMTAVRGVSEVHIDADNGKARLCVHYDPKVVTLASIQRLAEGAGAEISTRYRHEIIRLEGMDCSDCTVVIEHSLRRKEGVLTAAVSYAAQTLHVEYDALKVRRSDIVSQLSSLGYRVPKEGARAFIEEHRELLFALVAGLLVLAGWILGRFLKADVWITMPIYIAAYFLGGWDVARHAFHSLRERKLDTDLLMVMAALGAGALGEFFEGSLLLFLFSLGHALEETALDKARDAVRKLGELTPQTALVKRGNAEIEISVEELALGDVVIVRPGQRMPVDGAVVSGASVVNQAPVTGESVPVEKAFGDGVFAGTVNGEGALEIKITRLAKDSTPARVMRLVEEAQSQKMRTQELTERFTAWFVPAVLIGDLILLLGLAAFGFPFRDSFMRAMAMLVAASPCALALGTPSAMLAGIAQAARHGVLIKGGKHLETLGILRVVAFDKTGTLTHGKPEVTDLLTADDEGKFEEFLATAGAVESRSGHPLAQAVVRAAQARFLALPQAGEVVSLTGRGVRSSVNGKNVLIGNMKLFEEFGVPMPESLSVKKALLEDEGKTTMIVGIDNKAVGIIALADAPRANARAAIERLKLLGVKKTLLLTGDNASVGNRMARMLGIDEVRSELMPEDKAAALRELAAEQKTAMVGDGVNDAPALAAASVGIAMGGAGTDIALETADAALMSDDLEKLPFAVGLGRATRRVILQNLVVSLAVIALLIFSSAFGVASIGIAVLFHEGSTLLVAANSLRLLNFSGS